ncbi:hypothetical protein K0U27_00590 [archaeon]|nr:hypothetical protein [archaeon]
MNKKEKIKKLQEIVTELLGAKCVVCLKKRKVMQNHHMEYRDGELTYRDFNSNDDYQLYILPIIIQRPKEFRRVCRSDHWKITKATKDERSRESFDRLAEIVRETQ